MHDSNEGRDTARQGLRRWAGVGDTSAVDPGIEERIDAILRQAEIHGRGDEVLALLDSFLSWLDYHASRQS